MVTVHESEAIRHSDTGHGVGSHDAVFSSLPRPKNMAGLFVGVF